jgi:hypothetical protein
MTKQISNIKNQKSKIRGKGRGQMQPEYLPNCGMV